MVLFCFVLFCLKIKVKRDISRKVRTRSGFRDRNVPIEEQEGKKVFPTKVSMNDDGTVIVTYKKNGEIQTITLNEYASSQVQQNRMIKENHVPSRKGKSSKLTDDAR